jgi:hypothetical protein
MPHLPADEYDGFAFEVWMKLKGGASVDDVASHLAWAAGEHIGVGSDPIREHAVAEAAVKIMGLQCI